MIQVLIVEDEHPISELIRLSLTDAGYFCKCCFTGSEAADLLEKQHFDLILLDVMLPEISGFELMEYISTLDIPVIFISARGEVRDRVKGLQLGADDYLTKPFEIVELLARVESVLRRYNKIEKKIRIADIVIDTESRTVRKNDRPISLTIKEYEMLLMFVRNKNIALYRETLYEKVWESDYMGDTRTVDLHVQRLRKKLGWGNKIASVYKVGYRLEDQP